MSHTWHGSPVFGVCLVQPFLDLEPADAWWDWNCWLRTKKQIAWSLSTQDVCFIIALNPTVARGPGKFFLVPSGEGSYCLSTFPEQLQHYHWWLSKLPGYLTKYKFPYLYFYTGQISKDFCPEHWNVHQVRRIASSSVSHHIHLPQTRQPCGNPRRTSRAAVGAVLIDLVILKYASLYVWPRSALTTAILTLKHHTTIAYSSMFLTYVEPVPVEDPRSYLRVLWHIQKKSKLYWSFVSHAPSSQLYIQDNP